MIAIAGPDIPRELLVATSRYAGPLEFDLERPTPRASEWLESKFAPWARPLLETWAEGGYDHLEKVVFSRADDSSQRLYYYVCELQRRGLIGGPQPLILDIAKIARPTSLDRTIAKLRELAYLLSVSDDAVESAIAAANEERAVADEAPAGARALITGSPSLNSRIADAVSNCGFVPLETTLHDQWTDLGDSVEQGTGDSVAALGHWIYRRQSGPRGFADPAEVLAARVAEAAPKAVILWRIEEDEAQCWHLPAERAVLEGSAIASLVLTRRDALARDGAPTEIAEFLKGVAI